MRGPAGYRPSRSRKRESFMDNASGLDIVVGATMLVIVVATICLRWSMR